MEKWQDNPLYVEYKHLKNDYPPILLNNDGMPQKQYKNDILYIDAIRSGNSIAVTKLLENKLVDIRTHMIDGSQDIETNTGLMIAFNNTNIEMIRILLEYGADPNDIGTRNRSVFCHCVDYYKIIGSIYKNMTRESIIFNMFLEAGGANFYDDGYATIKCNCDENNHEIPYRYEELSQYFKYMQLRILLLSKHGDKGYLLPFPVDLIDLIICYLSKDFNDSIMDSRKYRKAQYNNKQFIKNKYND